MSTTEGILATVWTSLSLGTIPQAFALSLGASGLVQGLIAAFQALAGLTTLPAAIFVDRRSERRKFVAIVAGSGRISWFLVALAAFTLPRSGAIGVLLIVMFVSWAGVQIGVPAWTSWMNDLVPAGMRGRYFARRSIWLNIAGLIAALIFTRYLDFASIQFSPRIAFGTLFGCAGLVGIVNMLTLLRQPEPLKAPSKTRSEFSVEYFRVPLRNAPFRRFLTHFALWVFAQGVAGPFFGVYMLDTLKYPTFKVQVVSGFATLCTLCAAPVVGYLVDKYGNRALYKIAYVVICFVPLLWALTPNQLPGVTLGILMVAQLVSGVAGAMLGITQFNLMLRLSPSDNMPRYSALWTAVVGMAGFIAPTVGGLLVTATKQAHIHVGIIDINNYKISMLISMVLRLALIPLLRSLSEPRSEDVRDVLGRMASSSPMGTLKHVRRIRGASEPGVRARSARALGHMKARIGFEELVEALDDPVLAVRRQAALALGEMEDTRAIEPLLAALNNPGAGIRVQAVVSLGKLGDDRAAIAIIRAMEEDGGHDSAFTQAAAQAIAKLGTSQAAETLLEIAEEPEHPARAAAIQSLGELGDESMAEPLTEMLRSNEALEPQEVSALGDALAKLGDERAVVPLLQRLEAVDTVLLRREMANAVATLIGTEGEIYAWMAMDEYALDAVMSEMLTGHAKELRKSGRLSAALRAEAALNALGRDEMARAIHHLRFSAAKAGSIPPNLHPAADALNWIAVQARIRPPDREEMLVAVYAYDVLMRGLKA
ncbi:MAG TPA: MFS transporter [Armatimonadota bacterium]